MGLAVIPEGRRDSPPARLDSDEPYQRVTTTPEQRRASVPHLPAIVGTEQGQADEPQ